MCVRVAPAKSMQYNMIRVRDIFDKRKMIPDRIQSMMHDVFDVSYPNLIRECVTGVAAECSGGDLMGQEVG